MGENEQGVIETTPVPFGEEDKNVSYNVYGPSGQVDSYFGNHMDSFPKIGPIPNNSWREVHIHLKANKKIWFKIDVNNSGDELITNKGYVVNDNDQTASRSMKLYKDGNSVAIASKYGNLAASTYIDANTDYTIVVKYLNKSGHTFIEPDPLPAGTSQQVYYSGLFTGDDDKSQYQLTIDSFEAATYDDVYNNN